MAKFLDLYKECEELGKLPTRGLCVCMNGFEMNSILELLMPTKQELSEIEREGHEYVYWASGLPVDHRDEVYGFTPLRQTIILLCAALIGEFD